MQGSYAGSPSPGCWAPPSSSTTSSSTEPSPRWSSAKFFPGADPAAGTVAAFGTFAAGYVARPLGGIVFGHFGDRLGRKSMLLLTMGLMGGASFLIGLLPPMIAGSLVAGSGSSTPVALLICGGSVITALTVRFVRETSGASLPEATERPTAPHTEEISV